MSEGKIDYHEIIDAWREEIKQAEAVGLVYVKVEIYGCSQFYGLVKSYFIGHDEIAKYIFTQYNDSGSEGASYMKRREDGIHISPQRDGTMASHRNYSELLPIGFVDFSDALETSFGFYTGKGHEKVQGTRP